MAVSRLPQIAFLSIDGLADHRVTLIHNNGLSNVFHLFFEDKRRLPEKDYLTMAGGFLGVYLNAFYHVAESKLENFVGAVRGLHREEDY